MHTHVHALARSHTHTTTTTTHKHARACARAPRTHVHTHARTHTHRAAVRACRTQGLPSEQGRSEQGRSEQGGRAAVGKRDLSSRPPGHASSPTFPRSLIYLPPPPGPLPQPPARFRLVTHNLSTHRPTLLLHHHTHPPTPPPLSYRLVYAAPPHPRTYLLFASSAFLLTAAHLQLQLYAERSVCHVMQRVRVCARARAHQACLCARVCARAAAKHDLPLWPDPPSGSGCACVRAIVRVAPTRPGRYVSLPPYPQTHPQTHCPRSRARAW